MSPRYEKKRNNTAQEESTASANLQALINQNAADIKQIASNLSHHKLFDLKDNVKTLIGPQIDKTINATKGKLYNYDGKPFNDIIVRNDIDELFLVDKVLRDLLFFNRDLYMDVVIKN